MRPRGNEAAEPRLDGVELTLRNVDEHAGEEVDRGKELGFSAFLFGLIKNVVALFVVMESSKGDGAPNDMAAEGFESLGIGGVEEDIIVDAKSAPAP